MISLALCLSDLNGEINDVNTISPASFISLATSAIRRMFSIRSSSSNPRLLFSPIRMLSPSRSMVCLPFILRSFSSAFARVDFPDPERPVSHSVSGFCPSCPARISLVISMLCQVRFPERRRLWRMVPQAEVMLVTLSISISSPSALCLSNLSKTIFSARAISHSASSFFLSLEALMCSPVFISILYLMLWTVAGISLVPTIAM